MTISAFVRRLVIALFAITLAALLMRTQISSALVTRGDSLAYWGDRAAAGRMYARALFFDSRNGVAADRYAFNALVSGGREALQSCTLIASRYLSESTRDAVVLMDRALCYQHQRLLSSALEDFRRAGELRRDPRAFMFAALDERELHNVGAARELLREAVAADATFRPARLELARI